MLAINSHTHTHTHTYSSNLCAWVGTPNSGEGEPSGKCIPRYEPCSGDNAAYYDGLRQQQRISNSQSQTAGSCLTDKNGVFPANLVYELYLVYVFYVLGCVLVFPSLVVLPLIGSMANSSM